MLNGVTIGLFIGSVILNYWLRDIRLLGLLIPLFFFYLIAQYFRKKSACKRVYTYTYDRLFPFKVVLSKNGNGFGNAYLHSKIYIIDDEIAYLGSLNFTGGGTTNNYETRVRLGDAQSVQKIVEEFDYLMNEAKIAEVDIQEWGSLLYREPIN
ncbi:PLD-like domain-containing protein [Pricia antarctica]|uniref:PLD-like domain-containing protein n=1 Tax=Pricia antarctica TaxID=641691 RepID=A0A1G6X9D5_9FLAO|nr:phospholipase D family protein [Pricia antarctica]SDD74830.1 PLD-like domain-containing protein [Pricia antarctica]